MSTRKALQGAQIGSLLLAAAGGAVFAGPVFGGHRLTLVLVDGDRAVPTEARLSVTGSDSLPYRPSPDSLCLFHPALGGYFYSDSSATMEVPSGTTRIRGTKGLEYFPLTTTLNISSDTILVVSFSRWIEPRTFGWVGGDTHGHLRHPPLAYHPGPAEALLVMRAEGLRVANFLENGFLFTGEVDPLSDSTATFFSGEEYRSPTFGHLGLLGIDTLRVPTWAYDGWPLNGTVVREIRGHVHALATYAHPITTNDFFGAEDWPGTGLARGIWVDVALGLVDALDVISYSNIACPGFVADSLWTNLWNCGFTVPGLVGADAGLGRLDGSPLGCFRVYARVPDPHASPEALYDAWIEAARRGRTFVTSGPLITEFDVGGAGAGETLRVVDGMPISLPVHARLETGRRLSRIEVLVNGDVVEQIQTGNVTTFDVSTAVPIVETSWVTVRHDGYGYDDFSSATRAFAQPTPVLVLLDGDDLTSAESGSYALARIDLLDSLVRVIDSYPSPGESVAVAEGLEVARAVWASRSNAPPASFHLLSPCYACLLSDFSPLFTWEPSADPDSPAGVTYRLVLAGDAGFSSVLVDTSGLPEPAWSPGKPLTIGRRYWWRVRADDGEGARRWADEIDWWFEPSVETTVAQAAQHPFLFTVSPNPARSEICFHREAETQVEGRITILTLSGREIRSLVLSAGTKTLSWDGSDRSGRSVPTGLYLYRLESDPYVRTGKLNLVR